MAYKLNLLHHMYIHPIFDVSLLKSYITSLFSFLNRHVDPPIPIIVDDHEEFKVERVIFKQIITHGRHQKIQYKVFFGKDTLLMMLLGNPYQI